MCHSESAIEIMDREFFETRAKLLELAAALDRLDRAEGSVSNDARIQDIQQALSVLSGDQPDRAERIQLMFSLPYEENWREQFGLM